MSHGNPQKHLSTRPSRTQNQSCCHSKLCAKESDGFTLEALRRKKQKAQRKQLSRFFCAFRFSLP
jgi:hypothetical protein